MAFRDGAFGRWLGLEGRILMVGKDSWPSLLSAMWRYREKMTNSKPRRMSSPDIRSAGILILDFSASNTMRNKFLFFKPPTSMLLCCNCLNEHILFGFMRNISQNHRISNNLQTVSSRHLWITGSFHFIEGNSSNLWRLDNIMSSLLLAKHCWLLRSLFNWRGVGPLPFKLFFL